MLMSYSAKLSLTFTKSSTMNSSHGFWTRVGDKCRGGVKALMLLLIFMYRAVGAIHLGGACRFEPSCSEYATQAVEIHPPLVAVRLIGIRICKCHPWGPWGFDPVPPRLESPLGEEKKE
jgi:putative membrane protein insertion efficiency factor